MTPIAQRYLDQQKAAKEESPNIAFMIGTEAGGICGQLRKLMSLPSLPPTEGNANTNEIVSSLPRLVLIDVPSGGAFYEAPEGVITSDFVAKFVADYESSSLERKQLERA